MEPTNHVILHFMKTDVSTPPPLPYSHTLTPTPSLSVGYYGMSEDFFPSMPHFTPCYLMSAAAVAVNWLAGPDFVYPMYFTCLSLKWCLRNLKMTFMIVQASSNGQEYGLILSTFVKYINN